MGDFGTRLRELRENKGISQQKISALIGVKSGKQTISKWEKGQTEPSISELIRLCEVLDVSAEYLITGKKSVAVVNEPPVGYILKPTADELREKDEKVELQRELLKYKQKELESKQ